MKRLSLLAAASLAVLGMAACNKTEPTPTATPTETATPTPEAKWMEWQDGVDLVAVTSADLKQPNIIIHVARNVKTPLGEGPAGMVLFQPDPAAAPVVMGFVGDVTKGAYFGPNIFAGTPFETAPAIDGQIEIDTSKLPKSVSAKVTTGGHVFDVELSELAADAEMIDRAPGKMTPEEPMPPFHQTGHENKAGKATLKVDGKPVSIIVPPVGISGGPAAVYSAEGKYER